MSVMISIDDELAQRLEYQASAQCMSLDAWAAEILREGFALDVSSDRWKELNGRRLALIEKSRDVGLASEEEAELAALQQVTAKATEYLDQPMLRRLREYEAVADARNG